MPPRIDLSTVAIIACVLGAALCAGYVVVTWGG